LHVISDIQETRNLCQKWRDNGESIAFVPTMGCLHDGHLSLVKRAQSLAEHVVVSIFVNPLQFDDVDDLLKYPDTLDEDVRKLSDYSLDIIFTPDVKTFYPEGETAVEKIKLGPITTLLEGAQRPGHFDGVATVVKRLFDLIQPDFALFGEKDFQQLMVIRQLVKQFSLEIKIVAMPTFREPDGLAMSSRNIRLSEIERQKAPEIYQNLLKIKSALDEGCTDYCQLEKEASENLAKTGFVPEYVVIRNSETLLQPKSHTEDKVILIAAKLGNTRLIDNIRA